MPSVSVRESLPSDLGDFIRAGLRESDYREAYQATGDDPYTAVCESFSQSAMRYSVVINDKVEALFGVCPPTLLSDIAAVWFVATDEVEECPKSFAKISRQAVLGMAAHYRLLYNFVDADNHKSIQWLRWIGFDVADEPVPYGPFKHPFHAFIIEGVSSFA